MVCWSLRKQQSRFRADSRENDRSESIQSVRLLCRKIVCMVQKRAKTSARMGLEAEPNVTANRNLEDWPE